MNWRKAPRRGYARRVSLGLIWVLLLAAQTAGLYSVDAIEQLETWSYDLRINAMAAAPGDPSVAIVDLDERSLQAIGRWPWPRHRVAELVTELLDRQGAALVVFDVVFAEADESSGLAVLQSLAQTQLRDQPGFQSAVQALAPELDRDAIFAHAIRERPVILGYYFTSGDGAVRSGQLPAPTFFAEDLQGLDLPFMHADGYGANIATLQQAALAAGHVTPLFDHDGLTRRVPLLVDFEGDMYESLSLAATRVFLGGTYPRAIFGAAEGSDYNAIEWLQLGEHTIPVDARASALVPYHGHQGSFPYHSAVDVLDHKLADGSLAGRIVLIGTTALGLLDLRATPVGSAYPGVEIHANMIQGILDDTIKMRPAWLYGLELISLLALGITLALLLPLLGPAASLALTATAFALVIGASLWAWSAHNLVIPTASLTLTVAGVAVLHVVYGLFVESRAKRQIAGLFGQYVPPRVVEALADNPDAASMAGENRTMSVLFSDVLGFTTIAESLSAPELARLMNAYLSAMTRVIQDQVGTIDKYIGDAIMAFWGAPLATTSHARDAVVTALLMQRHAAELRDTFVARGWPPLHIGIGINTGAMSVGNMGSEFRRAYTVLGDAVNLGARLESLTRVYGCTILVGEDTVADSHDNIVYRELDLVSVKGKHSAVRIYEPLGLVVPTTPDAAQPTGLTPDPAIIARAPLLEHFITAYRAMQWETALTRLDALAAAGEYPELLALYRTRIHAYVAAPPPPDWDGAYTFTSK
ncbi:MAG: adenylate/guanylate cyclase domain-containing protein [Rhodocyclales bacterium]|nr:adenylate/guanylate cyclase domain-containing protein [Rhodocyclales bacterium]